jgi:hypothetical protein
LDCSLSGGRGNSLPIASMRPNPALQPTPPRRPRAAYRRG